MARFKADPNFERELKREPQYQAMLGDAAEAVASAAKTFAPVGATGDYHDSIEVVPDEGAVRVVTTDPFGHLVEWGSANNPPYAPLRRGVRAAGLRLDEQ